MMHNLIPVYEPSTLSQRKAYQIKGTLYRFTGKCPREGPRIDHPQWTFEPLDGQRKTATLKLNQNKVRHGIYEVPGMVANRKSEVIKQGIQQSLF